VRSHSSLRSLLFWICFRMMSLVVEHSSIFQCKAVYGRMSNIAVRFERHNFHRASAYYQQQKSSPGTLTFRHYRVLADIHGGSMVRAFKQQCGGQNQQFLVILVIVSLEPLALKPVLCSIMKCFIGFTANVKSFDLEWPWNAILC